MRRFFCDNITTDTAVITGDDAHHIARVLRMKAGDALSLCDGAGQEYDARIVSVSPESVSCVVSNPHASEAESPVRVTLFQCLPKTGTMELILGSSMKAVGPIRRQKTCQLACLGLKFW